jgi:hypothetical protein
MQEMKIMKKIHHYKYRFLMLGLAAMMVPFAVSVMAQTDEAISEELTMPDAANLRAFIELVRSDLRTEKAYLLAQNMAFTEDEAVEFWPLQRAYQLELSQLYDQHIALVRTFLETYDTMTEDQATQLADEALSLEERKTKLKRTYFPKFTKVITAKKSIRFFQIENQINAAIDLQIAASLPLIK